VTGKTLVSHLKIFHHGLGFSDDQMKKKAVRTKNCFCSKLKENPDAIFPHFNLPDLSGEWANGKSLDMPYNIEILGSNDLVRRHVYVISSIQAGARIRTGAFR
jgi:hypothetical protein